MRRRHTPKHCLALFVLAALGLTSGACAQGIGDYAFVHTFGLASATTARQAGMGGPISCVFDRGSGNPAFAALHKQPNAGLRVSSTDFDAGPELVAEHLQFVYPLRPGQSGLQLSVFSLDSSGGLMMLPGVGPVVVELSEEDISVHYGRKLSPSLAAGIGLSPWSEIALSMAVPGGPLLLDVEAKPDLGARFGLAYEYAPDDYAGLVCDLYQETASATGLALGLPPGTGIEAVFHTSLVAAGVSRHLLPNLLAVVEYQRGESSRGAVQNSLSGWHAGLEYRPAAEWGLRVGINDGHATCGLGYEDERWQVDYAFVSRWNDDIAAGLFGGSATHQLQAIYRW